MQAGMAGQDANTAKIIQTVSQISQDLMAEVGEVIIGKNENLRRVQVGILSNGNMLTRRFPRFSKDTSSKYLCQSIGL